MPEDFLILANAIKNECLLKTEALFVANRQTWFSDFAGHFKTVCDTLRKAQEESALSAISYLEYTMLYTNFINRQYLAEIFVYGDDHYLDESQRIIGVYDIAFLFVYFVRGWCYQ